jgi:hypothetical protein
LYSATLSISTPSTGAEGADADVSTLIYSCKAIYLLLLSSLQLALLMIGLVLQQAVDSVIQSVMQKVEQIYINKSFRRRLTAVVQLVYQVLFLSRIQCPGD